MSQREYDNGFWKKDRRKKAGEAISEEILQETDENLMKNLNAQEREITEAFHRKEQEETEEVVSRKAGRVWKEGAEKDDPEKSRNSQEETAEAVSRKVGRVRKEGAAEADPQKNRKITEVLQAEEKDKAEENRKKSSGKKTGPRQNGTSKKSRKKREKELRWERGKEIYIAGYLLVAVFVCMLIYFVLFETNGKESVLVNPLNNRTQNMAQTVHKGDVITSDGVVVAQTLTDADGNEIRYYPYANIFCHTVGYATKGGAGLESTQKINLLTSHNRFWDQMRDELLNQKTQGDSLFITIDSDLQAYCWQLLGERNGSIVVMEPSTGKILAMVSGPDFDPNAVDAQWDYLISDENTTGNLMNRASQGLYPPGSTFKILTLLEYIRENPDTWEDFTYTCNGTYTDGEYTVNCHEGHAHGELDIYSAFAQSCNGAFITIGKTLDPVKWKKLCETCGYNQSYSFDFQYKKSSFSLSYDADDWDMIQAAIGQGTTVTTPLLDTMITCAVANGGVMMKPYLIDSLKSADGTWSKDFSPEVLKECMTEAEADLLTQFMIRVITNGSANSASSLYAQVAGKTGSAQYSSAEGQYHAWFTGFAPAEDPEIAVTVLIEKGGAGGEVAAPVAASIFNHYFELKAQRSAVE